MREDLSAFLLHWGPCIGFGLGGQAVRRQDEWGRGFSIAVLLVSLVLIGWPLVFLHSRARFNSEGEILCVYRTDSRLALLAMALVYVPLTFTGFWPDLSGYWALTFPAVALPILLFVLVHAFMEERRISGQWKVPFFPVDLCVLFLCAGLALVYLVVRESVPESYVSATVIALSFLALSAVALAIARHRTWYRKQ